MEKPSKNDRQAGRLPVPYISPWKSLRQDLNGAIADLRLRLRELWRRNYIGDFARPSFWPSSLAFLFWPLLVVCSFLILVLLASLSISLKSPEGSVVAQKEVEELLVEAIPTGNSLRSEKNPTRDPKGRLQSSPRGEKRKQIKGVESDPLLESFLRANDFPEELLDIPDLILEGNAVSLQLSPAWEDLSSSRKIAIANDLEVHMKDLGYEELRLRDVSGKILSRSAKVGQRMIILDGDG